MSAPRSVLVTGCSSGIGRAAAIGLKARGWRVLATARTDDDLEALEALGVEPVQLDYRHPGSVSECAETVLERTGGGLYALFNNGAYGQPGAVEDLDTDVLRAQFEANLFGWHDLTRRLIPAMRRNGTGRIVQCSSVLGMVALRYRGAYIASKFALEGLTDTLRLELKGSGIAVSTIRPGPIATRFVPNAMAAFQAHVDIDRSVHREVYRRRLARMGSGGETRFKLPPEAVVAKLVHALESRRPKPYYAVTVPSYLMDALRRLLPGRALVNVLGRISDSEQ